MKLFKSVLIALLVIPVVANGQKEEKIRKEKDLTDFPYRSIYVRFFNPIALVNRYSGDEGGTGNIDLKIGYSTYRHDRLYLTHELFYNDRYRSDYIFEFIGHTSILAYEFAWNYRYNFPKHDWLKAELGFGIFAGAYEEWGYSPTNEYYTTILGGGPSLRSKLMFDIGQWGNVSLATNFRVLMGYAEDLDPSYGYYNSFSAVSIGDFLEIGVSFYLGQSKRQNKKEIETL